MTATSGSAAVLRRFQFTDGDTVGRDVYPDALNRREPGGRYLSRFAFQMRRSGPSVP
jgi:hypothetical protein